MKKGCYVPVGRCPTAGLRCRVGRFWTSATGRQHPSRRRDAGTAAAVTERATCQRPAQSRVPPPSLMAQLPSGERPAPTEPAGENKGRHTLGAVGQESSEETSVASKMPSRVSAAASVGAERCPPGTSAPRRGFLTENSPQDYFPIFLRLLTLPRPWGRCPPSRLPPRSSARRCPLGTSAPATFEKVDETFTRLRRARELASR